MAYRLPPIRDPRPPGHTALQVSAKMYIDARHLCTLKPMQVTITEFRRDLFKLVEQAMLGVEVHVTHKGKSFTLTPDQPVDRLSRITPLDGILGDFDDRPDKEAMRLEWEKDWAEL